MDLTFLPRLDSATLKFELAKRALESAKTELENAKQAYDDVLAQAESHGLPKAKAKKLADDRVQALFDSGILSAAERLDGVAAPSETKREKSKKKSAPAVSIEAAPLKTEINADEDLDFEMENSPDEAHVTNV